MTQTDAEFVIELFHALSAGDLADITAKDDEWLICHFIAPDGDGTHYSLWIHSEDPLWYLYNEDTGEVVHRVV